MRVSIQLTPTDLERLRFGYSPLLEMTCSIKTLYGAPSAYFRKWAEAMRPVVSQYEFPYLEVLHSGRAYVADFITPPPADGINTLEDELVRLRNLPPDLIRSNVETLLRFNPLSPLLQHFLVAPHDAVECLIEEIVTYWQYVFEPRWPQMRSVLENDMLYHARELALNGTEHMLNNLSLGLEYQQQRLEIIKPRDPYAGEELDFSLNGEGMYFTPSLFYQPSHLSWQVAPEWDPMVIYSARGAGGWFNPELPEPAKALENALGAARAQVLVALTEPAHTVALARMLHLTESAVSQHLKRLTSAGLVESRRSGHRVYYRLSERGSGLIDLFTGSTI